MSGFSFFSTIVEWISDDNAHKLIVTCERCGLSTFFMIGKHGDPASSQAHWMINHRTLNGACHSEKIMPELTP